MLNWQEAFVAVIVAGAVVSLYRHLVACLQLLKHPVMRPAMDAMTVETMLTQVFPITQPLTCLDESSFTSRSPSHLYEGLSRPAAHRPL
ncbi:MAG: hypothetical protein CM1200mP25_4880 [Acidobacteriota bacterium]|nr:MAG: hypothetical protein CM1200mP25_4880 [Acidobacteriota bacterium]